MTIKKNIYLATLVSEMRTNSGVEKMLKILNKEYLFFTESHCWLEDGRTEKEIITMLCKMGYDIPKDFVGSDAVFDGSQYDAPFYSKCDRHNNTAYCRSKHCLV